LLGLPVLVLVGLASRMQTPQAAKPD
jgi:hypothetical protein